MLTEAWQHVSNIFTFHPSAKFSQATALLGRLIGLLLHKGNWLTDQSTVVFSLIGDDSAHFQLVSTGILRFTFYTNSPKQHSCLFFFVFWGAANVELDRLCMFHASFTCFFFSSFSFLYFQVKAQNMTCGADTDHAGQLDQLDFNSRAGCIGIVRSLV